MPDITHKYSAILWPPSPVPRLLMLSALTIFMCLPSARSYAQEPKKLPLPRHNNASTNLTGMLGLNTIPSARMDPKGTLRIGTSTSDPYLHGYLGFQLAEPFYVSVRQTGQISSLKKAPDQLYPGIDFKLRLMEETATRPAVVVGMDSAFGHKRMASEYLSLSKRYNNFDFTGGIAWGRLGSAGHITNPLRALSSHFDERRDYNSEQPQNMTDWFTGQDIGFFGGVEYYTPLKGLSLKADYGANDYVGEQAAINGFDKPAPWSLGINYKPWEQIDLSAGIIGGEKFMARLSLQDQIFNWPGRPSSRNDTLPSSYSEPSDKRGNTLATTSLSTYHSTGQQVGYAVRQAMSQTADKTTNTITIPLEHKGLKGPRLSFIRKDIETAVRDNHGSPEEIWQDMTIDESIDHGFNLKNLQKSAEGGNLRGYEFKFILDNKIGISEKDSGLLYRNAALLEGEKQFPFGLTTGASARINLADNLEHLNYIRVPNAKRVRGDEPAFAARRMSIDRFYGAILKSLSSSTHVAVTAGYLEEMFAGYGGEILYRPFGKTFAIGAEGWRTYKRDPYSALNSKMYKTGHNTGHLNFYYEIPGQDMTAFAKVGQFLGEDVGVTLGLNTRFNNGAKLEGFITGTNEADADVLGGTTHLYGGVRFNLPLGNIPYVPKGSEIRITTAPFARDSGQTLDHPLPLYEVTEPIAYRQLSRSWQEILD